MSRKLSSEQIESYLRIVRNKIEAANAYKCHGIMDLYEYSIKSAEKLLEKVERMM